MLLGLKFDKQMKLLDAMTCTHINSLRKTDTYTIHKTISFFDSDNLHLVLVKQILPLFQNHWGHPL